MATVHLVDGRPLVIVKGAPETVFPLCTASDTRAALLTAEEMEQQGLQVLAVGYRFLEEAPTDLRGGEWESNLTLAGLIGMADAPRPGTAEAVRLFRRAGIRVVMFTAIPRPPPRRLAASWESSPLRRKPLSPLKISANRMLGKVACFPDCRWRINETSWISGKHRETMWRWRGPLPPIFHCFKKPR